MRKVKLVLGLLCSLILFAGCKPDMGKNQSKLSIKEQTHHADEQVTDNKMSDTAIIDHDAELVGGDWGVERILTPIRKHGFNMSVLLDPSGFPLVERFPDKEIVPIQGSYAENVIQAAEMYMGTPYEYGSDRTEPSSFDCSDFTRWVFLYALGVDLPWDSRSQAAYVEAFSKRRYTDLSKAHRGDLLFFTRYLGNRPSNYAGLKPSEKPITHMGIYLGNNKIIHSASKETGGVRIDQIRWKHLEYRFLFGAGILD
ncbi:C40 family peptidase [Paenibacillus sp. S3N08]|uniref:C40 family peptidase n=2 Tax=Paenibacillus agricola TaxID=2716264 RepID=A0ABX0JA22_9BACL|nr:C40 family peptidase [Paenibacillus agricola]